MFNHIPVEVAQLKRKNTENGRRYETPSGVLYPSVTTILSHKSKPFIQAWRQRVGEAEANRISNVASTRGTKIHTLCEDALNNKDEDVSKLSILDQEMYREFRPLLNDIDNIHCLEGTLYSDHLRLGGQVDCIAEYKGTLSVIDFKTSKKKKTRSQCYSYFMQCAAYAIMFEERTGIPVSQTVILMAQEDDGPAIWVEKRDDFVPQLIETRDAYENENKEVVEINNDMMAHLANSAS